AFLAFNVFSRALLCHIPEAVLTSAAMSAFAESGRVGQAFTITSSAGSLGSGWVAFWVAPSIPLLAALDRWRLKGLTHLSQLSLHGARITDAGLLHLRRLTNLKRLVLSGTAVTEAGATQLNQALPRLEIIL